MNAAVREPKRDQQDDIREKKGKEVHLPLISACGREGRRLKKA